MTRGAEFALLPIVVLKSHEQLNESAVHDLMALIRHDRVLTDPIWVSRGSLVILNGHHRVEALRRLGAERVAAWVLDYESDIVHLGRWYPGPPIAKSEVVRRGVEGRPFPPKTTRHRLLIDLPARPTPLSELLPRAVAGHRPRTRSRATARA